MSTIQLPSVTADTVELVAFCEEHDIKFDTRNVQHLRARIAQWDDEREDDVPEAAAADPEPAAPDGVAPAIPASVLAQPPEHVTATEMRAADPHPAPPDPELSLATVTPLVSEHERGLGEEAQPAKTPNRTVKDALEALGTSSIGRANRLVEFVDDQENGRAGSSSLPQIRSDLNWLQSRHRRETQIIEDHLLMLEGRNR